MSAGLQERPVAVAPPPLRRRVKATEATVYLAGAADGCAAMMRATADVSVATGQPWVSGPQRHRTIADGAVLLRLTRADTPDPRTWPAPGRGLVVGALVLAEIGRLDACFPVIDHLEALGCPFGVVVGADPVAVPAPALRAALAVAPGVPVVVGDWSERAVALEAVSQLGERALDVAESRPMAG